MSSADLLRAGVEHHRAGRAAEAETLYRQVLAAQPRNAHAWHLLGLVQHQAGELEQAAASIGEAVALEPSAATHYNLGVVLQALGRVEESAAEYRRAVSLDAAHALALGNLGAVLQEIGDWRGAEDACRRAVALRPRDAAAHCNLGVVLQRQDRHDAAIDCFRTAIALDPDFAEAYNNLGNVLRDREDLEAAVTFSKKSIAIAPRYADARNSLGQALQDQGKLDEAIASYLEALDLEPTHAATPWNLALALLMGGHLADGWAMHEWRIRQPDRAAEYGRMPAVRPTYAGEDLAGRSLLVFAEQGVGDEIFFAGVLSDAIAVAGRVVIECDARLVRLYERSFPRAEVIPRCHPPDPRALEPGIDWQCPVGSLPRWFRGSIDRFPDHDGYLVPDPQRVAFWKRRLDALGPSPKVGITWRSMRRSASRDLHYTALEQWAPILTLPNLSFVSLQYDDCRAELADARRTLGVEIHAWDDLDQMNDLDEVAALMRALELVIGPTTTPSILAGAVGANAWMLLTRHITWKTLGTDSMPMFPRMRIVWRPRSSGWDEVLMQVADDLRAGRLVFDEPRA